jgi:hypothetical protein
VWPRPLAAKLSLAGATFFLILLALLHFLKPEIDPSWQMISQYEIGAFGWVMRLAFLSLGFSYATLFTAIRPQVHTIGGGVGLALLFIGAVCTVMGGAFTMDPITVTKAQQTAHGTLHGLSFMVAVPTFPIAATLLARALTQNPRWRSARRPLVWATILTWVAFVGLGVSMAVMLPRGHGTFTSDVLIGWPNRLLIVAYAAWLMTAAWQAFALRRASNQAAG